MISAMSLNNRITLLFFDLTEYCCRILGGNNLKLLFKWFDNNSIVVLAT